MGSIFYLKREDRWINGGLLFLDNVNHKVTGDLRKKQRAKKNNCR